MDEALRGLSPRFTLDVFEERAAVDCAGEVVAGSAAAGALYDPQRAAVDGATRLQPSFIAGSLGSDMDDAVWDVTVFTKDRERLLQSEVADGFFDQVLKQARGPATAIGRSFHRGRHSD